ncbi:hypothetical protein QBC44DRAFT_62269 [Cladorrhinum sp. PSN332]|nr:hypothetical protein QBC44DRAFT_62269 [Cladorrhinum sp. PSN332]
MWLGWLLCNRHTHHRTIVHVLCKNLRLDPTIPATMIHPFRLSVYIDPVPQPHKPIAYLGVPKMTDRRTAKESQVVSAPDLCVINLCDRILGRREVCDGINKKKDDVPSEGDPSNTRCGCHAYCAPQPTQPKIGKKQAQSRLRMGYNCTPGLAYPSNRKQRKRQKTKCSMEGSEKIAEQVTGSSIKWGRQIDGCGLESNIINDREKTQLKPPLLLLPLPFISLRPLP